MKKPTFLLLLGPPKTATTSLQALLGKYKGSDFVYLGISQPRVSYSEIISNKQYIAELAYLYCANVGELSLPDVRQAILDKVREGTHNTIYIISEEMFLVNQDPIGESWQNKLYRLKDLLRDFEVIPMIAVRDPIHSSRSFYREIYANLPRVFKYIPLMFELSSYCHVYSYSRLLKVLEGIGYNKIRAYSFQKLCLSEYTYSQLIGGKDTSKIVLPNLNSSTRKDINKLSNLCRKVVLVLLYSKRMRSFLLLKEILDRTSKTEYSISYLIKHIS